MDKERIDPEQLLASYAKGIFPMAASKDDPGIEWYTANTRGVIPIDKFRVSKNVHQIIKQRKFKIRINTRFRQVMEGCANRPETWINHVILNSYEELHRLGFAHSVEVLYMGELAGGLYGVQLGAAFFGESMFKLEPEADKVALSYCHAALKSAGFQLWDTQMWTPHLAQFGCIQMSPEDYMVELEKAVSMEVVFPRSPVIPIPG